MSDSPSRQHPPGLTVLFFAEMWERFGFFGLRALLVLYLIKAFSYSDGDAYGVYGSYNALVYCSPLIGGLLADRLLGRRWAVFIGSIGLAVGQFTLLVQNEYLLHLGLALAIVGNGFLKPNTSAMIGKLYAPDDPQKDSGFALFYMGINLGAFVAALTVGWCAENIGWTYGFGIAGAGMMIGLGVFVRWRAYLPADEPELVARRGRALPWVVMGAIVSVPAVAVLLRHPEQVKWLLSAISVIVFVGLLAVAMRSEVVTRQRMYVLLILILFNTLFWAFFEQGGSSLTLFTDRNVDRDLFGWELPTTWGQALNPLFVIVLAPVFVSLWPSLVARGLEPSIPQKFALGLLQLGLGFGVLVVGARFLGTDGMTPLFFLVVMYLLHTTGELCLSPVGLSMVSKLAPAHMTGLVMGAWFLSVSGAHKLAEQIARLTGTTESSSADTVQSAVQSTDAYVDVFLSVALCAMLAGFLLLAFSRVLRRWLHGVR